MACFSRNRRKIPNQPLGTSLARQGFPVNIRLTSSLTPEDENTLAPALLTAMSCILNLLPIAYMIRIDTSDAQVYQSSDSKHRDPVVLGPTTETKIADPVWRS